MTLSTTCCLGVERWVSRGVDYAGADSARWKCANYGHAPELDTDGDGFGDTYAARPENRGLDVWLTLERLDTRLVAGMSVDSFDEVCTPGGAGGSFDRIDAPVE